MGKLLSGRSLIPLAEQVKSQKLSLVCYTGYLYQEILSDKIPYARDLLKQVDILIDGLYQEEEKSPLFWRGSRNQRVYFLTARYRHLEYLALQEGAREIELQVNSDGVSITGIFEMELWEKLRDKISPKR